MKDSQTELEEHICYLKHRVETLEALYSHFLSLGASPSDHISDAIEMIGRQSAIAASDLQRRLDELPYIEERLGCSSLYLIDFEHGECTLKEGRVLWMPILKMRSMCGWSYCAVVGHHSSEEAKDLADLRAEEIQKSMLSQLPEGALVKVEEHRCDSRCRMRSRYPAISESADVFIAAKLHLIPVESIAYQAQSSAQAFASYSELLHDDSQSDA